MFNTYFCFASLEWPLCYVRRLSFLLYWYWSLCHACSSFWMLLLYLCIFVTYLFFWLEKLLYLPSSEWYYNLSHCHKLTYGRGHRSAIGQAKQDDRKRRLFTEPAEKRAAIRAEKDKQIEERIKRLESSNKEKEEEVATLKAHLSQVQPSPDGSANTDNPAGESTLQAKSSNYPTESIADPMGSNSPTNKGSRKRRHSAMGSEPDDEVLITPRESDHEDCDTSVCRLRGRLRSSCCKILKQYFEPSIS